MRRHHPKYAFGIRWDRSGRPVPNGRLPISASNLREKRIRRGAFANDAAASARVPAEAVANCQVSNRTRFRHNGGIHLSKHSRDRAPGRVFQLTDEEVQSSRPPRLLIHLQLADPQKSDWQTPFSKSSSFLVLTSLEQVDRRRWCDLDWWSYEEQRESS